MPCIRNEASCLPSSVSPVVQNLPEPESTEALLLRLLAEQPWLLSSTSGSLPSSPETTSDTEVIAPSRPARGSSKRRRASAQHIPRPPNAFLIFRSAFCVSEKAKADPQKHHTVISKMAGDAWKSLPESEKAPFRQRAKEEKERHKQMYPQYKYSPASRKGRKTKADIAEDVSCEEQAAGQVLDALSSLPARLATFAPVHPPVFYRDSPISPQPYILRELTSDLPYTSAMQPTFVPGASTMYLDPWMFAAQLTTPSPPLFSLPALPQMAPFFAPELDPYGMNSGFPLPQPPAESYLSELPAATATDDALALSTEDEVVAGLDLSWLLEPVELTSTAADYCFDIPANLDVSLCQWPALFGFKSPSSVLH